jgi:hypothetical protein
VILNGRLGQKGDVHRFQVPVQPNQRYRFVVEAEVLGSWLDGVLKISDSAGKQLAVADDVDVPAAVAGQPATKSADPALDFTVPAGVSSVVLDLRDGRYRGGINFGYRLTIEPATSDFVLQQPVAEANVPKGGTVALSVPITRRGYNGAIQLGVVNLPPGLAVQGGYVPAAATAGLLTIRAAEGSKELPGPALLSLEGRALDDVKLMPCRAEQRFVLCKDGNVAASTMTLSNFQLASTGPEAFVLQVPAKLEVVHGYPSTLKVGIVRAMAAKLTAPIEVTGVQAIVQPPAKPPPGGLAFKPASAAPAANDATFTVTAPVSTPEGRTIDMVVQGKTKVDNKDQVVTSVAIPVSVVRPFALSLTAAKVELRPGQSAVIKGKIERRPVFKEAIQLKLDGLPKGVALAAPLKAIPPDQNDFALELKVDAKTPPTSADLSLTATATISGMPYAHPPIVVAAQVTK